MGVCNHKFRVSPESREAQAFTEGAIQLARSNELSLLSTYELWKAVLVVLEGKESKETMKKVIISIMTGVGPVSLPV
jgi:hypothetical protein